jgi:hypothetical protein
MDAVKATTAKYIKLGEKGSWERLCIDDGTLRLKYNKVPHEIAASGDLERLRQIFLDRGDRPGPATGHARQVLDFYDADVDTLWITFSAGYLWWAIAEGPVEYLGGSDAELDQRGSRLRRTVDGWHNQSVNGTPLRISELNGALTSTSSYQQTICNVAEFDYLIRKINDQELPEIARGRSAQTEILESIVGLLTLLHWRDFELLVELVFAQSGWRQIGASGGTQKTVDLELLLPTTGERAFVQVKSRTNQTQLNDYIEQFVERDEGRMFYVYHTARGPLSCENESITLVGPNQFAVMVMDAGLFDWLLKKAG